MVSPGQGVHALVVLVVVVAYTFYMLKIMNKQFAKELNSNLETEFAKNPIMKNDLEKYKEKLQQEEEKQKQVEALEEEQRNIAAKIEELKAKAYPTLKEHLKGERASAGGDGLKTKYVQMAGVTVQDESETRWTFQEESTQGKKTQKPSSRRSGHRAKAHNEF